MKSEDVAARLIKEYEERVPKEPNNLKLLRQLAELYTEKKQFAKALEYYERIKAPKAAPIPRWTKAWPKRQSGNSTTISLNWIPPRPITPSRRRNCRPISRRLN